jgi:hypothetical protein
MLSEGSMSRLLDAILPFNMSVPNRDIIAFAQLWRVAVASERSGRTITMRFQALKERGRSPKLDNPRLGRTRI